MSAGAVEQVKRAVSLAGPPRALGLVRAAVEAQAGRAPLWWPVGLAAGIGLYFALPQEPAPALPLGMAAIGLALAAFRRVAPVLFLLAALALGFGFAAVRAQMVATPLLAASTGEVAVTGQVVEVRRAAARRLAIVVEPHSIEGVAAENLPKRIRLTAIARGERPKPGMILAFRARLQPLPAPVIPGGYDYGRALWFEGIGATGRITSAMTVIQDAPNLVQRVAGALADLRHLMGQRIHAALDEPYASFAEALITGERSTIPPEINRSLLVSGLFHILSISGLHMWLVAGGVFWAVRAALALWPALALRWPIRSWAAGAGLAAGLFYMLLADSGVATLRSFIMIAVVFFAMMLERPALSTRNLAVAALLVLALEPEAAIAASFQMSFLAVLGLVAFYEAWSRRSAQPDQVPPPRHWSLRLARWGLSALAVSLLTSLIAGAASSVPAAYHFGRLSPYGVLANGLAIPVVGVVVMPAALISALLMPFGLEALPLAAMAQGLRAVSAISDAVAALPGADAVAPQPALTAVMFVAGGVISLSILAGPLRWAGLLPLALGGALALQPQPMPDILVDRTASNAAIRDEHGLLVPAHPRRARFSVEKWLAANGEEASLAQAARRKGWTCREERCTAQVKGRRVVYLSRAEARPVDCANADILIADFPLRGQCRNVPLRLDRFDVWRSGAQAVFIEADGLRVETARGSQGARPWVVAPQPRKAAAGTRQGDGSSD